MKELGSGFLENVYKNALYTERDLKVGVLARRLPRFFGWNEGHCQRQGPK
jgi:hypothetical protein